MELNERAQAFQKRRKTKPMTQEDIDAVVEKPLPGDYERGLRLHKLLKERMTTWSLYGRDAGKEQYLKAADEVRQERLRERQQHLDETTRKDTHDVGNSDSKLRS